MRKTLVIAVAAAVALATAAIAMAAVFTASGVSATTATFATDKVKLRSASCTGADGKAFTITQGRYTGTATFAAPAAELGGPLTIDARTTYSTTDGLGYVSGSFRVRDGRDDRNRLGGRFTATLKGSQLVGFVTASARGNHARVLGNLSATFVPATGFTAGAVGSTSSTAVLAVVAGPICPKPKPAPRPQVRSVDGKVSAVGDGSVGSTITIARRGLLTATCTRDATSPATTGIAVGTKLAMKCELIGTTWTLRGLRVHH